MGEYRVVRNRIQRPPSRLRQQSARERGRGDRIAYRRAKGGEAFNAKWHVLRIVPVVKGRQRLTARMHKHHQQPALPRFEDVTHRVKIQGIVQLGAKTRRRGECNKLIIYPPQLRANTSFPALSASSTPPDHLFSIPLPPLTNANTQHAKQHQNATHSVISPCASAGLRPAIHLGLRTQLGLALQTLLPASSKAASSRVGSARLAAISFCLCRLADLSSSRHVCTTSPALLGA